LGSRKNGAVEVFPGVGVSQGEAIATKADDATVPAAAGRHRDWGGVDR
jgi:hypothetical protein